MATIIKNPEQSGNAACHPGKRLAMAVRGCAREDDATDEARAERLCSLGVGCGMTGVCYAAVHGRPEQCGRRYGQLVKGREVVRFLQLLGRLNA